MAEHVEQGLVTASVVQGRRMGWEPLSRQSRPCLHRGSQASPHYSLLMASPPALFLLQYLGRFETLVFYWPSLLCLAFLLGRFLYMFVKALPIRLVLEPHTVSTELNTVVSQESPS